ncbi:hypothetical protein Aperf_G00000082173 [Anoplocephala perfoliata]
MTEVRIVPRDSTYHFIAKDSNGINSKPVFRNQSLACGGSQLSSLAQRFRENWLKCNPSFRDTDDSLTNLTWLFDMSPFSLESDNFGFNRTNKPAVDRSSGMFSLHIIFAVVFTNSKISWHPSHPYAGSLLDPQVRMDYRTKWTGKPPFSYASLICLAMRELGKPKVTLSDIYGWIMANFAYYRHTDSSWQNSVRHNLSLNKCFEKVPREKGERGKGGFWRVNPRHADWLEANLAKCRRAAPPPGPPPPIPRSLLLEKQQEHQQQQQQLHHQPTDGIYLTFSSPNASQPTPVLHSAQPNHTSTLICYRSVSVPPDVSNEIETVTVKAAAAPDIIYHQQQMQQTQPQPHVRRRKTPPCSMYPTTEADLVEVVRKPASPPHHQYSGFSNRKRLTLAASTSRQRHTQMWSQTGTFKRCEDNNEFSSQRSWKNDETKHSHMQPSSYGARKRRSAEMESSDSYYLSSVRRHQHQQEQPTTAVANVYDNGASTYNFTPTSECSSKRRVETQLRHQTLSDEQSAPILSEHINLSCLDSLPSIAEESDVVNASATVNDSWKEDFFDFPSVLPWQTIPETTETSMDEHSNLTVQCNTPDNTNNISASLQNQSSSSSSPSPLASFASFGQSVASSITSSNTDSGASSLVNPSDGLDLGPLDLDFDTVSSALNDLVESNSCAIPSIDVDFATELSDSMPKSLETPPTSDSRDFTDSAWNFDMNTGGVSEGRFFESGLTLT